MTVTVDEAGDEGRWARRRVDVEFLAGQRTIRIGPAEETKHPVGAHVKIAGTDVAGQITVYDADTDQVAVTCKNGDVITAPFQVLTFDFEEDW